ncbi:MAG: AAA family ATPase, partial [Rhodospirillales bacterium]|nr:AAA family ATPase [Rhodospirillales bacterium]
MASKYFGIENSPFFGSSDGLQDFRYFFMSEAHYKVLQVLSKGINENGAFVLLAGEVGTGKTSTCRRLIDRFPETVHVAFILTRGLTEFELLAEICEELEVDYPKEATSLDDLKRVLKTRLIEILSNGRHCVVIIDDAQTLSVAALEQIQWLTNLELGGKKLLRIMLVGQPELLDLLKGDETGELADRITSHTHLERLDRSETRAFIRHRLAVVGLSTRLFSRGASGAIYRLSRGIPRDINMLCDHCLTWAHAENRRRVTRNLVKKAFVQRLGGRPFTPRINAVKIWALATLAVGVILLGFNLSKFDLLPGVDVWNSQLGRYLDQATEWAFEANDQAKESGKSALDRTSSATVTAVNHASSDQTTIADPLEGVVSKVETENQMLTLALEAQAAEAAALAGELEVARRQIEGLTATAQASQDGSARLDEELAAARRETERTKAALAEARTGRQAAAAQAAEAAEAQAAEAVALAGELEAARRQIEGLIATAQASQGDAARLNEELAAAQRETEQRTAALAEARAGQQAAEVQAAEAVALAGELEAARRQIESLTATAQASQGDAARLDEELAAARRETERTTAALAEARAGRQAAEAQAAEVAEVQAAEAAALAGELEVARRQIEGLTATAQASQDGSARLDEELAAARRKTERTTAALAEARAGRQAAEAQAAEVQAGRL